MSFFALSREDKSLFPNEVPSKGGRHVFPAVCSRALKEGERLRMRPGGSSLHHLVSSFVLVVYAAWHCMGTQCPQDSRIISGFRFDRDEGCLGPTLTG